MHTEDTNAPWRYKITVEFENQTEYDIYARTIDERSYWILMFCRILDFQAGVPPEKSGMDSPMYEKLRAKEEN
jgi:hypothetical protein